jgi:hypothetical protein
VNCEQKVLECRMHPSTRLRAGNVKRRRSLSLRGAASRVEGDAGIPVALKASNILNAEDAKDAKKFLGLGE